MKTFVKIYFLVPEKQGEVSWSIPNILRIVILQEDTSKRVHLLNDVVFLSLIIDFSLEPCKGR